MRSAYIPTTSNKQISHRATETERRRDGETERRRDGEMERRRDGETERRRDGETERRRENLVSKSLCLSVPLSLCRLYLEPVSHESDEQSEPRHPSRRPHERTVNSALGGSDPHFSHS